MTACSTAFRKNSVSVGCVEHSHGETAPGGSQGSSGVCPGIEIPVSVSPSNSIAANDVTTEAGVRSRPHATSVVTRNSVIAKRGRDAQALVGVSSLTSAASSGVADFSDCEPFNAIASRTFAASEIASAETSSSIVQA